jgi:PEP-CTERM motif
MLRNRFIGIGGIMHRNMLRGLVGAAVLLIFLCGPSIASADGVTWDLTDVTLAGGGTASGSFVYDAATNTLSDVDITTSAGTLFTGATYLAANPGWGSGSYLGSTFYQLVFVPNPTLSAVGTPLLILYSTPAGFPDLPSGSELTLAAGSGEYTCGNAACSVVGSEIRSLQGDVVATPEPSSVLLLGLGLVGLMMIGKRKILQA